MLRRARADGLHQIKLQLERLLNTRTLALDLPHGSSSASLIAYGLPGFNHLSWLSLQDQTLLCQLIALAIRRQDQRFADVAVSFMGYGVRPGLVQLKIRAQFKEEAFEVISHIDVLHQGIMRLGESCG